MRPRADTDAVRATPGVRSELLGCPHRPPRPWREWHAVQGAAVDRLALDVVEVLAAPGERIAPEPLRPGGHSLDRSISPPATAPPTRRGLVGHRAASADEEVRPSGDQRGGWWPPARRRGRRAAPGRDGAGHRPLRAQRRARLRDQSVGNEVGDRRAVRRDSGHLPAIDQLHLRPARPGQRVPDVQAAPVALRAIDELQPVG